MKIGYKNRCFYTDFKNLQCILKKVSLRTILLENFGILRRPFFGCTFYKKMKIFEIININKTDFCYPQTCSKKNFIERSNSNFSEQKC